MGFDRYTLFKFKKVFGSMKHFNNVSRLLNNLSFFGNIFENFERIFGEFLSDCIGLFVMENEWSEIRTSSRPRSENWAMTMKKRRRPTSSTPRTKRKAKTTALRRTVDCIRPNRFRNSKNVSNSSSSSSLQRFSPLFHRRRPVPNYHTNTRHSDQVFLT